MNQAERDFEEAKKLLATLSPELMKKATELIKIIEDYLNKYPQMTILVLAYVGTKLTLFINEEEKANDTGNKIPT